MQTVPVLSPGVQIGGCAAAQVTLHFGQGGGPSTLQEEGLVMSHAGVAVGTGVEPLADWAFDLVFSPPTAVIGKITHARNIIVTARILFFIDYFYVACKIAGAPTLAVCCRDAFSKGSHDSPP